MMGLSRGYLSFFFTNLLSVVSGAYSCLVEPSKYATIHIVLSLPSGTAKSLLPISPSVDQQMTSEFLDSESYVGTL